MARSCRELRGLTRVFWSLAAMIAVIATGGDPTRAGDGIPYTIRGVVEPRVEATLSSQLPGRIVSVAVDRGDRVDRGMRLVEFDCAQERARMIAAEAERDGAQARLANLRRLDRLGSVGKVDVELAESDLKRTSAVLEERRAFIGNCVVSAPFDGVVAEMAVHAGETVEYGRALLHLLDDKSPRLSLLGPSAMGAWVRVGMEFSFIVDETGERLHGTVAALGARIDATSQTLPILATIDMNMREQDPPPLIAGMTGSATFVTGGRTAPLTR